MDSARQPDSSDFYLAVGDTCSFAKTISESDVYLFAGVTGDFSPNHVNAQSMASSAYGQRVAHGALLVGLMSTTSTMMVARSRSMQGPPETPVALGYDRIRFLRPVFFGDTMTVVYTVCAVDAAKRRTTADIRVTNQRGELVCAATGLLKWVAVEGRLANSP
jgi:acyl dehydratase